VHSIQGPLDKQDSCSAVEHTHEASPRAGARGVDGSVRHNSYPPRAGWPTPRRIPLLRRAVLFHARPLPRRSGVPGRDQVSSYDLQCFAGHRLPLTEGEVPVGKLTFMHANPGAELHPSAPHVNHNPTTVRKSLSTSPCNCGPMRPRRRTITERSTVANLWSLSTEVTRKPVRANSGCVLSTMQSVGARAPRTTLEIATSTMSCPICPGDTTKAGRNDAPVKSVKGKRVNTMSPRESVGDIKLAHHPLLSRCLRPPVSKSQMPHRSPLSA
jgi:hypothetical protein